jgi:hypothetical protein
MGCDIKAVFGFRFSAAQVYEKTDGKPETSAWFKKWTDIGRTVHAIGEGGPWPSLLALSLLSTENRKLKSKNF